ncbi:hypothetical protein [Azospirillum argentinense]|uniref:hypothetical protein n=1 Tax=Azospirillum argentinense TaxID=2970906 RepID=UPI00190B9A89|nr:hypothetical protein [Azospirillum argentinense]
MSLSLGRKAITLAGERVELCCTMRAATTISDLYGGLLAAQQRCINLDATAIVVVVNAGANRNGEAAKKTDEQVFAAGLQTVAGDVIEFITLLANGGRPPSAGSPGADTVGNGEG